MTTEFLEAIYDAVRELRPSTLDRLVTTLRSEEGGPQCVNNLAISLPQREQREVLAKLASAWKSASETCPKELVAGAVESAAFAIQIQSKAEICWSGPISSLQGFRSTPEVFRDLISGATNSAVVLSFSVGEVEQLRLSLESAIQRGVSIQMILEDFNVFTQESWSTRFAALGPLVLGQASILVWPVAKRRQFEGRVFGSMHVKCLIVDQKAMLLTSANWTGAAMQDNMELGIVLRDPELVGSVVQHLEFLVTSGILVEHLR